MATRYKNSLGLRLQDMDDCNISNVSNGQTIQWDASQAAFVPGSGGSGGGSVFITSPDGLLTLSPSPLTGTGTIELSNDLQETIIDLTEDAASLRQDLTTLQGTVSTVQTSLDGKQDLAGRGVANGYCPLGSDGLIPSSYIPGGSGGGGSVSLMAADESLTLSPTTITGTGTLKIADTLQTTISNAWTLAQNNRDAIIVINETTIPHLTDVVNTLDANEATDRANIQLLTDNKEDKSQKGAASGYCPLGSDSLVPSQYLLSVSTPGYMQWEMLSGTLLSWNITPTNLSCWTQNVAGTTANMFNNTQWTVPTGMGGLCTIKAGFNFTPYINAGDGAIVRLNVNNSVVKKWAIQPGTKPSSLTITYDKILTAGDVLKWEGEFSGTGGGTVSVQADGTYWSIIRWSATATDM